MLRSLVALAAMAGAVVVAAPASALGVNAYTVHPLVSNQAGVAPVQDPNLVNAWGLTAGPMTPWWVADNGTDLSTLYTGNGARLGLVVTVDGGPTGTVFNRFASTTDAFSIGGARPLFLFASEDGIIRGWAPAFGTTAEVAFDNSESEAIYKGLAIASTPHGPMLYATDFHNGRVDVFNSRLQLVTNPGAFVDPSIPAGFAPFGIQTIGSRIFVTYAMQDEDAEDDVHGPGLGFVDAYSPTGVLLARVASRGVLNAPWGLALAPAGFGAFANDLLVGNFGDGRINAYRELGGGHFLPAGTLNGTDGSPIVIDGLWALEFGLGGPSGPPGTLFFTAGPDDETNGLFGSITPG
jgi:uncharacterized protein (TIGR03118 family)